jgi:tRNA(Arg) A34 adenosine deaminase TadA
MNDDFFLGKAIEKAAESVARGGFPAGAVVVKDGAVVGEGVSVGNLLHDPTAHVETAAVRDACRRLSTSSLDGATLYASMRPCLMCLGAASWASVKRIVFACRQEKVSPEYYGGTYDAAAVNATLSKPLELVWVPSLEERSLEVVRGWERSRG